VVVAFPVYSYPQALLVLVLAELAGCNNAVLDGMRHDARIRDLGDCFLAELRQCRKTGTSDAV
jgi:hypothetical protein